MNNTEAKFLWKKHLAWQMEKSDFPKFARKPIKMVERKQDSASYEYLDELRNNIVEFVQDENNLVLMSEQVGNGKTTWALRIASRYIAETCAMSGSRIRAKFVSVPELFSRMMTSISNKDLELASYIKELKRADIVIFDDIGAGALNKKTYEELYTLINYRITNGKTCIYTTNLLDERLEEELGKRLASRILNMSIVIELIADDVRGLSEGDIE